MGLFVIELSLQGKKPVVIDSLILAELIECSPMAVLLVIGHDVFVILSVLCIHNIEFCYDSKYRIYASSFLTESW